MFGEIVNEAGERIDYTYHAPAVGTGGRELVVLGHGVTGNKDRPFLVALAEALARSGCRVFRMSFAGNGASGGRFVDATISKEVKDLGSVMDRMATDRVTYVGHSMGGAVGVIRASEDARICRLVSLAGMVHTADFARREFGMVQPGAGRMWDDPACPLSQAYMDDMNRIGSVVALGAKIRVPWLLVHGTEDDVVPVQDSRDILQQAATGRARLVELPGVNHVFAGDGCGRMIEVVAGWLAGTPEG